MDPAIADQIKAANPDILLVAFGNPKQEKWIHMYADQVQVPVMIGVGGTLDFIAGNLRRAPVWMQRTGFEWLYRLMQEPRRLWRRYIVDLYIFSVFFVRQWWLMHAKNHLPTYVPAANLSAANDLATIAVNGPLTVDRLGDFHASAEKAISVTPYIAIDLAKATFLDSSAIGALVGLGQQAREMGGEVFLVAIPAQIHYTLSVLKLDDFFVVFENLNACEVAVSSLRKKGLAPAGPPKAPAVIDINGVKWGLIQTPRRLDTTSAAGLYDLAIPQLNRNPYLILDLDETVTLASAGLATLLAMARFARQQNGELMLIHCRKDVLRVIELGKVERAITVAQALTPATS